MARIPRSFTVAEGHLVHKVWRGHNREANLARPTDKMKYLEFLNDDLESERYDAGAWISALCVLDNHLHELFGIVNAKKFSNHMRRHHSRYGMYFNRSRNRCGKVAQDRAHTTLIENDAHEMNVVFYIHANPVRANIVRDARQYYWSTHNLYAFGKRELWMRNIKFPKWYLDLGPTLALRQRRYRMLYANYLRDEGLRSVSYSKIRFAGDPAWYLRKKEAVRQWRRKRRVPP